MRRLIFIPLGLLLVAVGIVAAVKAQDWNSLARTQQEAAEVAVLHNPYVDKAAVAPQRKYDVIQASAISDRVEALQAAGMANQAQAIEGAASPSDQPAQTLAEPAQLPKSVLQADSGVPAANQPAHVSATAGEETTPQFAPYGELKSSRRQRTPKPVSVPEDVTPIQEEQPEATQPETVEPVVDDPMVEAQADTTPNEQQDLTPQQATVQTQQPQPRLSQQRPAVGTPHIVSHPTQSIEQSTGGNTLLTSRGPAIQVTTAGPHTVTIGKPAEYAIQVNNQSDIAADDVVVVIDVPQWADVRTTEATRGAARYESVDEQHSRIRWHLTRIEGGGSDELKLNLVAGQSRPFDLAVGWGFQPPMGRTQIEVQEPKLHMTLTGPRDVLYGETRVYTITVSNPGTGDAENVVVALAPTAGQDSAGQSEIGTLAAGDRKVIEVELTARQAGELSIVAKAVADGGLNVQASEQVHVRRAALEIGLTGAEIKYAGTVASYQMRIANTGDATADNVVAAAALPRGAQFVSSTDSGEYDATQGRIDWQVGALRPGGVKVLEFRCVLAEAGPNRVEVAAAAAGQIGATTESITQVEALADLKLLVNDPKGPLPVGEDTLYEVHVINRGTKAAEGISVVGYFSEGIEPVAVEGGAADIGVGQVQFREIPRLAPGQQIVLKISAKASQPGAHVFRAELTSTTPETVLAHQETTRFYGKAIKPQRQVLQTQPITPQDESAAQPQAEPQRLAPVETAEPSLPPRIR